MTEAEVGTISLAFEDANRFKQRFDWIDTAAVELNLEVAYTYNALMAAFGRALARVDESRGQGRIRLLRILFLSESERIPQHEIGRQLGVTSANVTYLIDGLEKEGLVSRVVNQADRRVTFVELTERGEELCTRVVPLIGEFMAATASGLTEDEKRTFISLLAKFRQDAENGYLD